MSDGSGLKTGYITLILAERGDTTEFSVLEEDALKKMRGVHPLFIRVRRMFGDQFVCTELHGAEVRIHVLQDEGNPLRCDLQHFVDGCYEEADALQRNANLEQPRFHKRFVKQPGVVKFLEVVSAAGSESGLQVAVKTGGKVHCIPVLDHADFVEPASTNELRQEVRGEVKGLVRDDMSGHKLLITDAEVEVLLPRGDPMWEWGKIRHVLDDPFMLVGSLVREKRRDRWTIDALARLELKDAAEIKSTERWRGEQLELATQGVSSLP